MWYDYTRSYKETQDIDTPAVARQNAQGVNTGLKMDLLNALRILSGNRRRIDILRFLITAGIIIPHIIGDTIKPSGKAEMCIRDSQYPHQSF